MPQRLDDHIQEAVVVPGLVRQAPDQVQTVEVILQPLPGHPSSPRNLPLVTYEITSLAQMQRSSTPKLIIDRCHDAPQALHPEAKLLLYNSIGTF